MRRYLWLLMAPVLIYFVWYHEEQGSELSQAQTVSIHPKAKSRKLFLSKRTSPIKISEAHNSCAEAAAKLDDIDFNIPIREWVQDFKSDDFAKCKDSDLKERITLIQSNCFGKDLNEQECFTNLLMFRSSMRVKAVKDPSTREELADLIMAEFSKKTPDFKRLKEFSAELLRHDPNDNQVEKVWAMSAVMAEKDLKQLGPEIKDEIYQAITPEEINSDPDLRGLDIIMRTNLESSAVESYTRDILESFPDDLSSREMLGWSLWQQGRKDEAIAQVDAILAKKDDPYLRKIREQLIKPNAGKEVYPGRLNLGVRLEDLWN